MAKKVSLTEVKTGICDICDLQKMNALLDFEAAQQHAAAEKAHRS